VFARKARNLNAGNRHSRPRARSMRVEQLEDRLTPSLGLVTSINSSTPDAISQAASSASFNNEVFFPATDGVHGVQLWQSNGTTTSMISINPSGDANPANLTVVGNLLFFSATDSVHGTELWATSGTQAGTYLVKDINQGVPSSNPATLVAYQGKLFFTASTPTNGLSLWESDGTTQGTQLVLNTNAASLSLGPTQLTVSGNLLYFVATDGSHGQELWETNGTAAGTFMVKDINTAKGQGSFPANLTDVNGTLFFVANDGLTGPQLWESNGTAAGTTEILPLINPSIDGSSFANFSNLNGTLFFQANNGTSGGELFYLKGGTTPTLVEDIFPKQANGSDPSSFPANLTPVGNTLFFTANDGTHGTELWETAAPFDSTSTKLVKDISAGNDTNGAPLSSAPRNLTNVNGTLYFTAFEYTDGRQVWKSDGTTAGTVLVDTINPGTDSLGNPFGSNPLMLTNVNGALFFSATDQTHGRQLWESTAGTPATTTLVGGISQVTTGSVPQFLTNVNGTLYFSASVPATGRELYSSDGTAAGTQLVADIQPGTFGSAPQQLTNVNGTLFFTAFLNTSGQQVGFELFKAVPGTAGVTLVDDIFPGLDSNGNPNSSFPQNLTSFNGKLLFTASTAAGTQVWTSDGTGAGTTQVSSINAGGGGGSPNGLTVVGSTLFFVANDGVDGTQIWKTDGTSANTTMVTDINAKGGGISPSHLTNVNGTLFFSANDGTNGNQLWKSDGTAGGTTMVTSTNASGGGIAPQNLTNVGGTLYFTANDGTNGRELWDSTSTGTAMVADINPGAGSSNPQNLTSWKGDVFFAAFAPGTGVQLYVSDGTAAGTQLLKVIAASGQGSSDPGNFLVFNGVLYFTATDGVHGFELYRTDGTTAGTTLVADINPIGGANPSFLTSANGHMFFAANDNTHGTELWDLTPPGLTISGNASFVPVAPTTANPTPNVYTLNLAATVPANDTITAINVTWGDGTTQSVSLTNGIPSTVTHNYPELSANYVISASISDSTSTTASNALPVKAIMATHTQGFIAQLYRDLLGRDVDAPTLSGWSQLIDSGQLQRGDLAGAVVTSVEYRGDLVNGYYQHYLGRTADAGGLNTFVNALGTGATDQQVQAFLIGSPEFYANSGGTNNGFLSNLFLDVLGRPIDAGALTAFNDQLNAGTSRSAVATEVLTSSEAYSKLVNGWFVSYLRRPADSTGLNAYVSALQSGTRDEAIIAQITGSAEYFGLVPT
jgi:ELWxxDGT repeat protein